MENKDEKKLSRKARKAAEARAAEQKAAPKAEQEAEQKAEHKTDTKADELQQLQEKLNQTEQALSKEKDDYIRLMAEFENYRRRSAAERLEMIGTASEKIIVELLPLLDDCERALEVLRKSAESPSAKEGTELIYNKLVTVLKARGLKEIDSVGKDFDTEYMEAVAQFPVQDESLRGKVYDTVQKGYMLGEKVIRYAKVVVGQ